MTRYLLGCALTLGTSVAFGQTPIPFLRTTKASFVAAQAEIVCSGRIGELDWSPDGKFLLVDQFDTPGDVTKLVKSNIEGAPPRPAEIHRLLMYNVGTGKVTGNVVLNNQVIQFAAWFPGTSNAIVSLQGLEDSNSSAMIVSATGNRMALPVHDTNGEFYTNPTRPIIAVGINQGPERRYVFIGATGNAIATTPALESRAQGTWTPDGAHFIFVRNRAKEAPVISKFNLNAGLFEPMAADKIDFSKFGRPEPEVRAFSEKSVTREGNTVRSVGLVAGLPEEVYVQVPGGGVRRAKQPASAKEPSRLVLSTDATGIDFSPAQNAAAFQSQGYLVVRRLVPVDPRALQAALEAEERKRVMNDAKEVALGIIMNTMDNDDLYPANTRGWQEKLSPYLKGVDALNSFIYTFPGGKAGDMKNPSETELGYVPGPNGKAIAYADGHVKWIPNP